MAKVTPQQLEEELKKEQADFGDIDDLYDQDTVGKDTEEELKRVIGNDVDPEEDGFSLAEEIEDDEEEKIEDQDEEILSLDELEEDLGDEEDL